MARIIPGAMAASAPTRLRATVLLAAAFVVAGPAPAQILPWEVTVAEIESGRLRGLASRLAKQNVLYQLRLGDVRKVDLVETASRIDRVLESLQRGSPSYSIPEPWTPELRKQLEQVDALWGPLRRIAVASAYDTVRMSSEFISPQSKRGDPLLIGYFDDLSREFVIASEQLLDTYNAECTKTGLEVCATARTSGYATMLIERAAKEAVYVVAGIDATANRKRLKQTIAGYQELRRANQQSPFFAEALNPDRGQSAKAAGELLTSLRDDWDAMQGQFVMLAAGDEENFDLVGSVQSRLVAKVERMTAALVRYASLTYGS
jgi:hypothetical protein